MVLSGCQWFSVLSGYQWFSPVVLNGSQWLTVVLSGYQWLPVVISGYQWFSVVLNGSQWLPVVLNGSPHPQSNLNVHTGICSAFAVPMSLVICVLKFKMKFYM